MEHLQYGLCTEIVEFGGQKFQFWTNGSFVQLLTGRETWNLINEQLKLYGQGRGDSLPLNIRLFLKMSLSFYYRNIYFWRYESVKKAFTVI